MACGLCRSVPPGIVELRSEVAVMSVSGVVVVVVVVVVLALV